MVRRLAAVAAVLALTACGGGSEPPMAASTTGTAATTTDRPTDPSLGIEGIVVEDYPGGGHVAAPTRVAYDRFPPFGGRHDAVWADCNGAVYRTPVRNENMVHSLEHGAVWITYHPDQVTGETRAALERMVAGQPYLMISPYPDLDRPISLQSWGHQLKLDAADDPRIGQFIQALRANPATHPEPGATCDPIPGRFDVTNPPPFDPSPPGPDAAPVG